MGAVGLKKYGLPSNSAAVHGFRYNARCLADYLAREHFGFKPDPRMIPPHEVVDHLLTEATYAPELWNQQSYLARVIRFDEDLGPLDEGIHPLHHYVDADIDNSIAIAVETDDKGNIHPAVYITRSGRVDEHQLAGDTLLKFENKENRSNLNALLKSFIG